MAPRLHPDAPVRPRLLHAAGLPGLPRLAPALLAAEVAAQMRWNCKPLITAPENPRSISWRSTVASSFSLSRQDNREWAKSISNPVSEQWAGASRKDSGRNARGRKGAGPEIHNQLGSKMKTILDSESTGTPSRRAGL